MKKQRGKKMIQAVFFDIDGTLVPMGKETMPSSTLKALYAMREKGIKLFVATGRPPNSILHVQKMFSFDGYLTANGQYCFHNDTIIYEKYIPHESIQQIIPYIEEHHIPVLFAMLDQSYRNIYNTDDYDSKWDIADLNTLADENIIQIMAHMTPQEDKEFLKHLPYCKSARWTDRFADIIPEDGGKEKGIDKIIEYYHIPIENVMAFGDGGNDITMLNHVPYGVAMRNASDEVKTHAFYVTTDAEDNGIANALIHFGVIKKDDI